MKTTKGSLYLQTIVGFVFIAVAILGTSYEQLSCVTRIQRCRVQKKLFGFRIKTLGVYNTQAWQSARVGKTYQVGKDPTYYVRIRTKKSFVRLKEFDTRTHSFAQHYAKHLHTYLTARPKTWSIQSSYSIMHLLILIVFGGGGIQLLWGSFRGEVIQDM